MNQMRKDGGNPKLEMGSEVGGTNGKEPKKVNVGTNTPAKLEICQNYSADIYSGLAVSKANVDLTEDEKKLITNLSTLAEETIEFGDEIVGKYDKYMEEGGQEDKLPPNLKQKFAELGNKIKKVNELIAELKATLAKKIAAKTQQDAQSSPANSVGSPQNQSTNKLQLQQAGESIGINHTNDTSTLSSESPSSGAGVGSSLSFKAGWDRMCFAMATECTNIFYRFCEDVLKKIPKDGGAESVATAIEQCVGLNLYKNDIDRGTQFALFDLAADLKSGKCPDGNQLFERAVNIFDGVTIGSGRKDGRSSGSSLGHKDVWGTVRRRPAGDLKEHNVSENTNSSVGSAEIGSLIRRESGKLNLDSETMSGFETTSKNLSHKEDYSHDNLYYDASSAFGNASKHNSSYAYNYQSGDSNNMLAGGSQSGSDFSYGDDGSQSEEPSDISELQDPNGLITEKGKDSLRGIVKLVNGHFKGVEIDNDSRTLIMEGESNEIVNFLLKNSRGSMEEIGASIRGIIYDEINKKVGRNVIADDDDFLGNLMNQGVDYKKIEEKTGRKINEIKENIDKLKLAFVVCLAKESNKIEGLVNEFTAPMKKVKKVEWDFTDVLWRMEDYYKRVLEFAGTKFAELLAQYSNAETGGIFKNLFKPGKNKSKDSATFDSKKMKNLVFNSVKYVICENIKKWAELTKNKNQGFEKGIDLIAINGMAKLTSPEMPKNVIDLLDQATSYFAGSPKDMGEFCANRGLGIRAGETPPEEKPAFSWDLLWERCSEKLGSDGMPDKETMKKDFLRFTGGEGENDLKKLNLQDGERVEKLINDFIKAEADDLSCKDAAGGTLVICVPKDKTKIGKKGKKGKKGEILVSPLHIAWAVERFVEKVTEEGYKSEGMFKFLKTKNQVIAAHERLEKLCKSGVFSRWLSQGVDSVKYVDLKNPKGIQHDLEDRARDARVRLRVMVGTEEIGTFGSSRYQKIMKISPYSETEQREQAVSYTWSRAYEQGGEYSGLDAVWHKGKHKAAVHSTRIEAFAVEIADFVNSKGEKYIEKKFSEKALKELRGDKKDETNKANKKLIRKQRDQRIDLFVRLANEIIDYRNKLGRKLEGYLKDTKINYSEFNSKQHGNAFSAYHESLQKLYEIWKLWLDAYHSEKGLLKFLDEKTYERLEKKGSYSYVSADGKEINKTVWEIPKDRITVEEIRKEPEKDEDEDYSESSANASRGSLETGKSQSEYYENSWGRSERKTGTESHYESNVSELTELSGEINDDSSKIESEFSAIPVTSRPSSGNMNREVPKKVSKDSGPRVNERGWGANDGASVNTVARGARSFSSESFTMSGEQSPMTELEIAESKCKAAESAYRSLDEEIKKIKEDENLGNVEKKQKIQALETEYGSLKKLEKKHKETKKRYNQLKKKSGKNKKK